MKDWEDRLILDVDPSIDETIKGEFIQKHKSTFDEINHFVHEVHDWNEH